MMNNSTDLNTTGITSPLEIDWTWKRCVLVVLLSSFAVATIFGNLMIVVALVKVKRLRTVTNLMILSLAFSDLIMGMIVMPFAISIEALEGYWPYGSLWCHLWHSFDVLGSTASILNLCIISLDRYWAVTNPINYPRLMSRSRGWICIILVWISSAIISFPVISWWELVDLSPPDRCLFTRDSVYLILSSTVSFYIPMTIMIIVYVRVYQTISGQVEHFKLDRKHSLGKTQLVQLRAHRGGQVQSRLLSAGDLSQTSREGTSSVHSSRLSSTEEEPSALCAENILPTIGSIKRKSTPLVLLKKRMQRTSMEHRVARTLGIVMSIFLLCWLPFFAYNLLFAVCPPGIVDSTLVFPIVTWLGYLNSGVNPVIYALSMKDLRKTFADILCSWRSKMHQAEFNPKGIFLENSCQTKMLGDAQTDTFLP